MSELFDVEGLLNDLANIKKSCDEILVETNDQYLYGVWNVVDAIEDAIHKNKSRKHWSPDSIKW